VVVHELCHLLEASHNARFHALMDKFFPRWKDARRETRQICKMEEDDGEDQSSDED
jgi:predicted metal-dependent hydrolase